MVIFAVHCGHLIYSEATIIITVRGVLQLAHESEKNVNKLRKEIRTQSFLIKWMKNGLKAYQMSLRIKQTIFELIVVIWFDFHVEVLVEMVKKT